MLEGQGQLALALMTLALLHQACGELLQKPDHQPRFVHVCVQAYN